MTDTDRCTRCHGTGIEPRPDPSKTCAYYVDGGKRRCRQPAAGVIKADRFSVPALMCDEHLRPEAHPPDLRDKLIRWAT